MTTRIPVGTEVVVTETGLHGKKRKGVVVLPELVKGYNVRHHDDGSVTRYPDKKVRVAETRTTLRKIFTIACGLAEKTATLPPPEVLVAGDRPVTPPMWALDRPNGEMLPRVLSDEEYLGRAQPKPPAPRRSKSYLAFVRKLDCCNCGTPGPSDPHHEGKRGVGQKTSDMLVIPLCRRCHSAITDKNQLPRCVDGKDKGRFDREESLHILHGAQANLLTMVLERLAPGRRAEVLAAAVASLDDETLAGVLKS